MSSPSMNPYSDLTDINLKTILLGPASVVLGAIFASSVGTMMLLNSHAHQAANEVRVLLVGAGVLAVLGVLLGATLPPKAKVKVSLAIAALAAVLVASGIIAVASPAGTPSCPGPQDCDTGFGIGAMILTAVLAPVYLALVYIGRLVRSLTRRAPIS